MPIPLPAAIPLLVSPSMPQALLVPLTRPPHVIQATVEPLTRLGYPKPPPNWPLPSRFETTFRTMNIGIETEFYLNARNRANSREELEDFIEIVTTNHNRQVLGHPHMRFVIQPRERIDEDYDEWCFVRDITNETNDAPCEPLPI